MEVRYLLALKAQRLEIRFVYERKSNSLQAWSRCSPWNVFRCYMRLYVLYCKRSPPSLVSAICLYCRHPPPFPDARAKKKIDCYVFKCRFIQQYVPLNQEMQNYSNVDQNGNWRTRPNLIYSDNVVTFIIAVSPLMSRSPMA